MPIRVFCTFFLTWEWINGVFVLGVPFANVPHAWEQKFLGQRSAIHGISKDTWNWADYVTWSRLITILLKTERTAVERSVQINPNQGCRVQQPYTLPPRAHERVSISHLAKIITTDLFSIFAKPWIPSIVTVKHSIRRRMPYYHFHLIFSFHSPFCCSLKTKLE